MVRAVALCLGTWLTMVCLPAHAEQRADYMLSYERPGLWLHNDFFGTGLQTTLEDRRTIFGKTNGIANRLQTRISYPLSEVNVQTDLRLLFFTFGATAGVRYVWRNIHFEPDEPTDRGHRRVRDALFAGSTNSDVFGFIEGRIGAIAPLNEYVVFATTGTLRYEGRQERSFDWLYAVVHDAGFLGVWEAMLFVKNKTLGGIGPYVQWLSYPIDGRQRDQWSFGFNAVRRLGLIKRNDLLFLTVLVRPGDDSYGQHAYFMPVRGLLVYRFTYEL